MDTATSGTWPNDSGISDLLLPGRFLPCTLPDDRPAPRPSLNRPVVCCTAILMVHWLVANPAGHCIFCIDRSDQLVFRGASVRETRSLFSSVLLNYSASVSNCVTDTEDGFSIESASGSYLWSNYPFSVILNGSDQQCRAKKHQKDPKFAAAVRMPGVRADERKALVCPRKSDQSRDHVTEPRSEQSSADGKRSGAFSKQRCQHATENEDTTEAQDGFRESFRPRGAAKRRHRRYVSGRSHAIVINCFSPNPSKILLNTRPVCSTTV